MQIRHSRCTGDQIFCKHVLRALADALEVVAGAETMGMTWAAETLAADPATMGHVREVHLSCYHYTTLCMQDEEQNSKLGSDVPETISPGHFIKQTLLALQRSGSIGSHRHR